MKKILVLMGLMIISQSVMAAVDPSALADVNSLRGQGFSESTLQIADDVRYMQESLEGTYTKYYTPKQPKNKLGAAYTAAKRYWDLIQDDGKFTEHEINFTNTWTGEKQWYSDPDDASRKVNSL